MWRLGIVFGDNTGNVQAPDRVRQLFTGQEMDLIVGRNGGMLSAQFLRRNRKETAVRLLRKKLPHGIARAIQLIMNRIESVLREIEGLDPFPRVAVHVLELVQNDASPGELVTVIEEDPGLTSKVLALANSASQGSQVAIDSIYQATTRLGMRAVANLALSTGCASHLAGYGGSTVRSHATLWSECLHTALFSRQLAAKDGRIDPELAYTVGLLQNIGHIVSDRFMTECASLVEVGLGQGRHLLEVERAVFGLDHAQIGAVIARRWGLPRVLIRGIQFHHSPSNAGEEELLCNLCGLSERLAADYLAGTDPHVRYEAGASACKIELPTGEGLERITALVQLEFATIEG